MSREERQALLHEGVSTTQTLSAFGEFVKKLSPTMLSDSLDVKSKLSSTTQTTGSQLVETR